MPADGLLIHIGYHKTGTTFLQEYVFDGKCTNLKMPWHMYDMEIGFSLANPFEFDPQAMRRELQPGMDEARAEGLMPILTHETLSGNVYAGGADGRVIADSLKATFPEARVLILIREQKSILRSIYKQYVRVGGTSSIKRFLSPPPRHLLPLFHRRHFEYHHLIKYYFSLFGRDNVMVVPFEHFKSDNDAAVDRICEFAGAQKLTEVPKTKSNSALGAFTVSLQRRFSFLFYRTAFNPAAPLHFPWLRRCFHRFDARVGYHFNGPFERRLKRRIAEAVGDHYRQSNRATSELLGIDLEELGYDL